MNIREQLHAAKPHNLKLFGSQKNCHIDSLQFFKSFADFIFFSSYLEKVKRLNYAVELKIRCSVILVLKTLFNNSLLIMIDFVM